MFKMELNIPSAIFIDQFDNWNIDLDNPLINIIQINGVDYIINYLDPNFKKNKGGNSFIFTLHSAQDFEEYGYDDPLLVLKISKISVRKRSKPKSLTRFQSEVKALYECNDQDFNNVIRIFNSGNMDSLKKTIEWKNL